MNEAVALVAHSVANSSATGASTSWRSH